MTQYPELAGIQPDLLAIVHYHTGIRTDPQSWKHQFRIIRTCDILWCAVIYYIYDTLEHVSVRVGHANDDILSMCPIPPLYFMNPFTQ